MIRLESLTQLNKGCVLVVESKLNKKGNFHCSHVRDQCQKKTVREPFICCASKEVCLYSL